MSKEGKKIVVVRMRVYEIIKGPGSELLEDGSKLQVSKNLFGVLDEKVRQMLLAACKRTIANKRKTVYPHDL